MKITRHTSLSSHYRTALRAGGITLISVLALATGIVRGQSSHSRPGAVSDIEIGERIYREGILSSGESIRAVVQGDVLLEGSQLNCASCHRLSGYGADEGGRFLPPVTGPSLFQPYKPHRADLIKNLSETRASANRLPLSSLLLKSPRNRPAYTDESLARALREGKDPSGREFDPLMPRYTLSDKEMGHLIAYLKTLSSLPPPGVEKTQIHFATIVTEGVPMERRQAMLDVVQAFVGWKNENTRHVLSRPGYSFMFKDSYVPSYREWTLHVWELKGSPETWNDQLKAYYQDQPVFALLSGIGVGDWRPIHDFCESSHLPCFFPNTDLPVISPTGTYTIYYSKGLTTEAEVLAHYLHDRPAAKDDRPIVQVFRRQPSGQVPAQALRKAFEDFGMTGLQDEVVESPERLTPDYWRDLVSAKRPSMLILWLPQEDLQSLTSLQDVGDEVQQICLSYNLFRGPLSAITDPLRSKMYFTYPFTLPQDEIPQLYRIRGWLKSRNVKQTDERLQINTYFALSVADHALTRLLENFSQNYLIESVEHKAEEVPNPGIFPFLSLGVGQRFASKGAYIVKLSNTAKGGIEPVSEWIVP